MRFPTFGRSRKPLELFGIYGVIGRSGTTFVRNVLCKADGLCCLNVDNQGRYIEETRDQPLAEFRGTLKDYTQHDIRHCHALKPYTVNTKKIDRLLFKLPVVQIIQLASIDYARRLRPIFVLRHPVAAVLSATRSEFLTIGMTAEQLLGLILDAFDAMKIAPDERLTDRFPDEDTIGKYSIVTALNLRAQRHFFENFCGNDVLLFYFDAFGQQPGQHVELLAKFTGVDPVQLKERFHQPFFRHVTEEGGIVMDSKLDPSRHMKIFDQQDGIKLDRIWDLVGDEAAALGYSDDFAYVPRSRIGAI